MKAKCSGVIDAMKIKNLSDNCQHNTAVIKGNVVSKRIQDVADFLQINLVVNVSTKSGSCVSIPVFPKKVVAHTCWVMVDRNCSTQTYSILQPSQTDPPLLKRAKTSCTCGKSSNKKDACFCKDSYSYKSRCPYLKASQGCRDCNCKNCRNPHEANSSVQVMLGHGNNHRW